MIQNKFHNLRWMILKRAPIAPILIIFHRKKTIFTKNRTDFSPKNKDFHQNRLKRISKNNSGEFGTPF